MKGDEERRILRCFDELRMHLIDSTEGSEFIDEIDDMENHLF